MGTDSQKQKEANNSTNKQKEFYDSISIDILDEISMYQRDLDPKLMIAVLQQIAQQAIPIFMTMMQISGDDNINTHAYEIFHSFATPKLLNWMKEE